MGFFEVISKSVTRRVVTHAVLGTLTIKTGGIALPLHILAEKFHIANDVKTLVDATKSIANGMTDTIKSFEGGAINGFKDHIGKNNSDFLKDVGEKVDDVREDIKTRQFDKIGYDVGEVVGTASGEIINENKKDIFKGVAEQAENVFSEENLEKIKSFGKKVVKMKVV